MDSRGRRAPGGEPIKISSANPVRDAKSHGLDLEMSRAALEANNAALRIRFTRLVADGESVAAAEGERETRVTQLLSQLQWTYDGIADDIAMLEKAPAGGEHRDKLLRAVEDELATMAELATGSPFAANAWRPALDALRAHAEKLIRSRGIDAVILADIDLALERIEHIEKTAGDALGKHLRHVEA